ncbi:MAG TPA: chemotaxis protein CheX [Desulfobacteraceae bacterium]|nr:chemotaxis protein CheX [Desulfobacteraceae bacterium]
MPPRPAGDGLQEEPLQEELQQIIVSTTREIFETMIPMDLSAGPPAKEQVQSFRCHVSGILGFSGDIRGMVTIHCPDAVAMAITANFLGMDVTEVNDDVIDAIGELANMVTGGIKEAFSANNQDIKLSVPTVVAGKSYNINNLTDADWVIIPFTVPEGTFLVELKIKPQKS